MPRIPIVTSEGRAAVSDVPARVQPNYGLEAAGEAFQHVEKAIGDFAKLERRVRAQREETELIDMRARYDADIDRIKQDLTVDPSVRENPQTYYDEFLKRATIVNSEYGKQGSSSTVKRVFGNYINKKYPADLVDIRGKSLDLQASTEEAKLFTLADTLSNDAARKGSAERDATISTYEDLVDRAYLRGIVKDPVKREQMIKNFRDGLASKNMRYWADNDPEQFRKMLRNGEFEQVPVETSIKVIEHFDIRESQREAKSDRVMKQANEYVENYVNGEANYGRLPDTVIEDGLAGRNPFIADPVKWRRIKEVNENPPSSQHTDAIRWVITELDLEKGSLTRERVEQAKSKIRDLVLQSGKSSKEAETAAKYLTSQILRMREVEASELNAGLKYADDYLKAQQRPATGIPFIDRRRQNQNVIDEAEIRRKLRENSSNPMEDAKRYVDDLMKKRGGEVRTKQQEDTDSILRNRR